MRILIAGGGIFGLTAALALRGRGHDVTVVDPGPIPHPLAESTDISKVVRIDYGADADYTRLGERAIDGWRRWNRDWPVPPLRETGVLFTSRAPMAPGSFEHDSYALLTRRGHPLRRLDAAAIAARFPAWREGVHVDGYFNPSGGWAHASAVVTELAAQATAQGVAIRGEAAVSRLVDEVDGGGAIVAGAHVPAELTILCTGSWVPVLLPELARVIRAVGQPVFHLRPDDPTPFAAARFPVFCADVSRTGWYGFPANEDGLVKIANHGVGVALASDAPAEARTVTAAHERALREFLADVFPALATAPIAHRRLCVYGDSRDEHFWIARHPDRPGVAIAAGGSVHGFKFAPVLGDLIADLVLGETPTARSALAAKFRWRPELDAKGTEASRHHA